MSAGQYEGAQLLAVALLQRQGPGVVEPEQCLAVDERLRRVLAGDRGEVLGEVPLARPLLELGDGLGKARPADAHVPARVGEVGDLVPVAEGVDQAEQSGRHAALLEVAHGDGGDTARLGLAHVLFELREGPGHVAAGPLQQRAVVVDLDGGTAGDGGAEERAGPHLLSVGGELVLLLDGGGERLLPAVGLGVGVEVEHKTSLGEGAEGLPAVVRRDDVRRVGRPQLQWEGLHDVVPALRGAIHRDLRVLTLEGGDDPFHPGLVGPAGEVVEHPYAGLAHGARVGDHPARARLAGRRAVRHAGHAPREHDGGERCGHGADPH